MFARIALALIMVLAVGLAAQARPPAQPSQAAVGNNAFALEVFDKLRREQKGNLFFSPYSVRSALALCYAGARGEVASAMAKALHFPGDLQQMNESYGELAARLQAVGNSREQRLSIANALWVQKGMALLKQYQELAARHYGARAANLDFADEPAARDTINAWVEEQTQKMIQNLIPAGTLTPQTRLVITNAIFFLGKWEQVFKPENTRDQPFHLEDGGQVSVPLMNRTGHYPYAEDNLCQAVDLPYRGGALSMLVLLPHPTLKLGDLEDKLDRKRLRDLLFRLRSEKVELSLPRFNSSSTLRMDQSLRRIGLEKAFGTPDFSGITGRPDLVIGAVLHKARVEVEETGTKAAAATALVMRATAMPDREQPEIFRADHPFLYLIRDRASGAILFMGRLNKPGGE